MNKLHNILENIDFNNPSLDIYDIDSHEFKTLYSFINSPLIKNDKKRKIYKEYEFMYEEDETIKHGFIDLLIVYDDYVDIIDYKLSNIDDVAYIDQLKGYKSYIGKIVNKEVNLYLYSLYQSKYVKVG